MSRCKSNARHFLDSVRDHATPRTDGENGLRVLKILHAAGQSIRDHGKPVSTEAVRPLPYFVHPSAYVDEPCEIGEGTKIWHFSHVMNNTRIGRKCVLGSERERGLRRVDWR